jgi:hypothetical protein
LIIGTDEDSLDEIMDILTNNTFQTKTLEVLGGLKVHKGRISVNQFSGYDVVGVFCEENFNSLVKGLSKSLLGVIFTIDILKDLSWEYISYIIHSISDSYHLPFTLAIMNFHEQTAFTMDIIRYKLNLNEQISLVDWDAVDPTTIHKLLSSVISLEPVEKKESDKKIKDLIENVPF